MTGRTFGMLRPGLRWALVATLMVCAAAGLWPAGTPGRLVPPAVLPRATPPVPNTTPAGGAQLPAKLSRPDFALRGRFDPFVGVVVSTPAPEGPVAVNATAPPPEVSAPPPPPTPVARFMGRITAPSGERQLFLQDGERIVEVRQGAVLSDGYVIESVDAQAVTVQHPAWQSKALIALPTEEEPPRR